MARICVARDASKAAGHRGSRWLEVVDAEVLHKEIAGLLAQEAREGDAAWAVLAYEGLPDFGPHPNLGELLAWLDAVDEYGPPFEALWATGSFDRVLQAAEAFADSYQGTYADTASWACRTLALMGQSIKAQADPEAYACALVASGQVRFIPAVDGGLHVFWND
ncbi:antirestriction protein ArdA [Luteimonas sp. MHLX1A]|uniref:antirestriction protein ArdA n=1 Tax=Alterluteimonas muca TaxID=2878684 RepID=UPI001E44B730|nr:antirestriction protein ArdA [Luteimonas sp. MHLX1A]MCD9045930.1 antirestriction protein ArdA [Luteimonas sp. MHLX1A]